MGAYTVHEGILPALSTLSKRGKRESKPYAVVVVVSLCFNDLSPHPPAHILASGDAGGVRGLRPPPSRRLVQGLSTQKSESPWTRLCLRVRHFSLPTNIQQNPFAFIRPIHFDTPSLRVHDSYSVRLPLKPLD